ncbi:hypothetical protein Bpfe_024877, partial [Biomphalaria pfeifferi]
SVRVWSSDFVMTLLCLALSVTAQLLGQRPGQLSYTARGHLTPLVMHGAREVDFA